MSHLCDQQRETLHDLLQQAVGRARAEEEVAAQRQAALKAADQTLRQNQRQLQGEHEVDRAAADQQYQELRQRITARFEEDYQRTCTEYEQAMQRIQREFAQAKERTETAFNENSWTVATVYEADKKVAKEERQKAQTRAQTAHDKIQAAHHAAVQLLQRWHLLDELSSAIDKQKHIEESDPARALQQLVNMTQAKVDELRQLTYPTWVHGLKLPLVFVGAWVVLSLPAGILSWWYYWLAGTTTLIPLVGWGVRRYLARQARQEAQSLFSPLCQALAEAEALQPRCEELAERTYRQARVESKQRHQQALEKATEQAKQLMREFARKRDEQLRETETTYPARIQEMQQQRDRDSQRLEEQYGHRCTFLDNRRAQAQKQAEDLFKQQTAAAEQAFATAWAALAKQWQETVDQFLTMVRTVADHCQRWFPPWEEINWQAWRPPQTSPPALRFGHIHLTPDQIPHGIPQAPGLVRIDMTGLPFPALLPFPGHASLLLEAFDVGRQQAVAAVQELMLRWLTALPPGKVRLTVLDPVGRGENFAAFMHLADYDEQLIGSRIWTESSHIEHRLSDLTAQMENIIQKFLRNQFQTLEEYNAQAGEIAEPYRLLVVANFPVNFTADAARRLVSLVASGARCGIHALITVDSKQDWPQGFSLADLEQACATLVWQGERFQWRDADFANFPLTLAQPPDAEFCTRLLQVVGEQAKLASRVEVPFSLLVPPPEQWWTADTRKGLSVPLGKAGATRQQCLELGQGTAQHALLAGKTGSGKSTLLHALITQIALRFSPEEINLFLVDFKKGVEFKTYAVHELPHARVVAVESEREFGLSVLQRLDVELQQRGALYRQLGVTDLQGYRDSQDALPPAQRTPLPRLLLLVDEFQEFFVEDDKIAQEAALLLDRLVRQGRAFGIHVLLGSQTLGGAYSLARSTIDQMAVRIALQCSETDAHMILNKDNGAARLLSRPGEAIYNAANGLLEGNNLFQVVWLADDQRDRYLQEVRALADARGYRPTEPLIVFEGTMPSLLRKNPLLQRWLSEAPAPPSAPLAWLGEAVAIKDPTAAVFRRHSGANLLLIGQDGEAACNMLVAALVSLSAQLRHIPANGAPSLAFVVGAALEAQAEQVVSRLAELLPVRVLTPRELPELLNHWVEEVNQRQKDATAAPPRFLAMYGLQRLRDLRKADDDFSFGRRGEGPPSPAKQFAHLAHEGPPLGVHILAWCDTLNNLNRTLDRQALRDFEMRVLMQMSAADSSNLIDSPVASRLGVQRALFYTEEQGKLEKFRPYGLPELDWLASLKRDLRVGS